LVMIRLGVIGYGYWGPNVVRNFATQPDCQLTAICDGAPPARGRAQMQYPGVRTHEDAGDVLTARDIDAVAIVTPVSTHYDFARRTLKNGKHISVKRPFTPTVEQAEDLTELAARQRLTIMVDHTFLFTGAVRKMKSLIEQDVLGRLYYYDSTRVNLGL